MVTKLMLKLPVSLWGPVSWGSPRTAIADSRSTLVNTLTENQELVKYLTNFYNCIILIHTVFTVLNKIAIKVSDI